MNKKIIGIIIALTLSGCSTYKESDYLNKIEQDLSTLNIQDVEISTKKLTDLFNDKNLSSLINLAFEKNPNLQKALLDLEISRLQEKQTVSNALPQITSSISSDKEKDKSESYSSKISVNWEIDLWNKVKDAKIISQKNEEFKAIELESMKSVLAANIIKEWISLGLYDELISIEEKKLDSLMLSEKIATERYKKGIGDAVDIKQFRQNILTSKSSLEDYKKQRNTVSNTLNVLIGDIDSFNKDYKKIESLNVLSTLNDFGLQNLQNRPDLRLAYNSIEQQELSTKIAYKNMLPSFSLSAALSDTAEKPLESLFVNPIWNILGQITMPIYNGGNLKATAEIEEIKIKQSYWEYKETLLTAFKETNDSVLIEKSLLTQQAYIEESLKLAKEIEKTDKDRYLKGLITVSDYLSSQRTVFNLETELASLIKNRMENRINLGLALGLGV